jgi:hypothetical protein
VSGEIDDGIMTGNGLADRARCKEIEHNRLRSEAGERVAFRRSAGSRGDIKSRANENRDNAATDYTRRAGNKDTHAIII